MNVHAEWTSKETRWLLRHSKHNIHVKIKQPHLYAFGLVLLLCMHFFSLFPVQRSFWILKYTGLVVVGTRFPPDLFMEHLFKPFHSHSAAALSEHEPM